VIEQAFHNTMSFHFSYIAIPYTKNMGFQEKICRDYGIGVLACNVNDWMGGSVQEIVKPKFNRKAWTKRVRLHEYQKRSIAGSPGGSGDIMTPFKITVENMVTYIKRHPECSLKEMMSNIDHHYHSDSSARTSIYQWIRQGVIKEIRIEKRKLYLNLKP